MSGERISTGTPAQSPASSPASSLSPLLARLSLLRRRAAAALWLERLAAAFALPAGLVAVFLIAALLGLPDLLVGWAHAVLLGLSACLIAGALIRAVIRIVPPSAAEIDRRIERQSGLSHRPLQALSDQMASGESALWAEYLNRLGRSLGQMRVGAPRSPLSGLDRFGLRGLAVTALVAALVIAGPDAPDRLLRALQPRLAAGSGPVLTVDAWITPPAYTGVAPILLGQAGAPARLEIPAGSVLLAQVNGSRRAVSLVASGETKPLDALNGDSGAWRIETPLSSGETLALKQGERVIAEWPVAILADQPPQVAFAQEPGRSPRGSLRLDYRASDDYGVETLRADVRLVAGTAEPMTLKLPVARRKTLAGVSYQDLTDHPWAGLPVEIRLIATDALGQTSATAPASLTLPERVFNHPIARAIIAQRKVLVATPERAEDVARAIEQIAGRPDLYDDDTLVFLGLTALRARLYLEETKTSAVEPVQRLMWDLAVRVEEGNLGTLERDLRAAEQAVRDAIDREAPDEELQRAINELQQAMNRFMDAMARRAMENAQNPDRPRRPRDPNAQVISSQDLQRMMDRARELARQGQREQAQALLEQLRQMLENLANADPQFAEDDGAENPANQAMQNLQDLTRRQRDLMDRGAQRGRQPGQQGQQGQQGQRGQRGQQPRQGQQGQGQGQQPGDGGEDWMNDLAADQDALRRGLGELMRQMDDVFGGIPDSLGRAERAMREAQDALQQGQGDGAANAQNRALQQMREAMRDMARQMQQLMGQGQGQGQGQPTPMDRRARDNRDPLGRNPPNQGQMDTGDVTIPDDNQIERSRGIYDELRRRAADPDRPPVERDYIDRLLKRF